MFVREATRREAQRRGVSGWARNRDDGAVEAVFEGDHEAVEALTAFIRQGPGRAEVERVEASDEEPEGLEGFRTG